MREADEEHTLVKEMLVKADELAAEDDTFDAKVKVLRDLVQHHVREEENEIFPECRDHMSEDRLAALGAQMQGLVRDANAPAKPAKKTAKSKQHKH